MKRYDSYKDSGVEWIGEVPSHWKVLRLKFAYIFKTGATPSSGKKEYYGGDFKWANIGDLTSKYVDDTAKHITKEAISSCSMTINPIGTLMYSFKLSVGTVAFCSDEMYSNEAIASFIPQKNNLDYLYYAAPVFIIHNSNRNIYNAPILNQDLIKNAIICLCPKYEQEQIASFLDSKCGEIDKVISTQEKRIALLQELKQSIITHAVTKGLNPDVKMKDSGIEWIGEVPEHWKVCKIKRLSVVKRGASPRPIENPIYFDDNGQYSWVRIADVTDSKKYLYSTTQKLSKLGSSLSVKMHPGEIFLSIAGTVGKPIITKIDCCIHDGFVWFPNLKIEPEYLYYIFLSGRPYLGLGKLGTQLNLNTETVGYISIPIPEGKEITDIVSYLDKRCASIDTYISKAQKEIELLQEYKQSLITEVVTGKRKVC